MSHAEHIDRPTEVCWQWWVDLWQENNETVPEYNQLIANELYDFHGLLDGMGILYDEITGGRVSKPNTDKNIIAQLVQSRIDEEYQAGYDEGYDAGWTDGKWEAQMNSE